MGMATTTERGLLMLSPLLMPTTATTTATDWLTTAMDMPTMDTTATPTLTTDTTTERGPLMLSPRLMPTTATLTPPTDTAMPTVDTTATPTLTTDTTDTDIIIKLFVVILFKN